MLRAREEEKALRGARADRDAGRRTSRLRYRIDHGDALLQRRRAQDEPGQGLGGPSGAAPYESLPPDLESGDTLLLARFFFFECDIDSHFDSRTENKSLRATVKVAMDDEQAREQERVPGR